MLPLRHRSGFYRIAEHLGFTLRRLLFGRLVAMLFEGVFAWFLLTVGGIPMAGLLGLVTGVLAFIPNIGAITSGILMIAVGFSAGYGHGIWCIIVYFLVHNADAYVVVPYVARRTVDIAPAVLLAMQLLMAALFGILGVLFADPILATLKVVLIDLSNQQAAKEGEGPETVAPGDPTSGAAAPAAGPVAAVVAPASAASAGASPRRRGRSSGRAPRT
jgi:predicted PurR-regulated permease PerM